MRRARTWRVIAGATVVAVLAGCGMFRGDTGNAADAAPAPVSIASSAPPSEDPSMYAEASPSPSVPPSEKPSGKSSKQPEPTPTEDPNHFTPPDCAEKEGKEISKKTAKNALVAAAGRTYWPGSAPKLKVSSDLVKAIAWHESGWGATWVNCDGGRGLMQVMPDTEAFINQRFEKSYDSRDPKENATLGANYLAWLTKYFGDNYFDGDYSLSAGKCKTHESRCLLNMVIAGYNVGAGTVDEAWADKQLPAPDYVNSVRHLMKSCYCDRY